MSIDRSRYFARFQLLQSPSGLLVAAFVNAALAGSCLRQVKKDADTAANPASGTSTAATPAPVGKGAKLDVETNIPPAGERTTPVASHGQLSVKGAALLDASQKPVVLRGQAFGWDNWWPQYYNDGVVRWLWEDWCVDVVRRPWASSPTE